MHSKQNPDYRNIPLYVIINGAIQIIKESRSFLQMDKILC